MNAKDYVSILPPALKAGDSIGLICPSSPMNSASDMDFAITVSKSLGLNPVIAPHAFSADGYLAGSDEARADDVNAFFRDPKIRGVFSPRGGFGLIRLLPLLDYDALKNDPKVIMGFSDLTTLINAVTAMTGIVTFHGPTFVPRFFTEPMYHEFRNVLMTRRQELTYEWPMAQGVATGIARGVLIGGNLTTFSALIGTPYVPQCESGLVLVEDLYEIPRRLDRSIRQLKHSQVGRMATGFLSGKFFECVTPRGERNIDWSCTLRQFFISEGKPALIECEFGHVPMSAQSILPIGIQATLDASQKVVITEGPVLA
jgi:muramoyltetrapeptide carboxypeptidase